MSEPQLNMLADGSQPVDDQLGVTQRAVMRVLRRRGELTRDEVGQIIHAGRGKHPVDETCMFCGVDADGVIESLTARRLAEAVTGGVRLPHPEPDRRHDDIPY